MSSNVGVTAKEAFAAAVAKRRSGLPLSSFLQISDRCNHACVHCYQVLGQRGELTTAEVERLLDDLAATGVLFVTLSGGEVTLRPDFLEIVSYARKLRFAVSIYTNGYLVDDQMAARLAEEAVLEVHVSIYSHDAKVHDSVTRVAGSWHRTIAGIQALRRHGITVVMKMPLMPVNAGTYGEFVELARSLDCFYQIDPTINVAEDGEASTLRMRASEEAVRQLISDPLFGCAPGKRPAPKPADTTPCGACTNAFVSPDGTLRPCPTLPFSLGNVRDTSIQEAYRTSAARFVQSLTWDGIPACRVCDLRDYCNRCHANALLEDGDLFGPASASCRWATARYRRVAGTERCSSDPEVGPFGIAADGSLFAREWDRGGRQIPEDVESALVARRSRDAGRQVHLRVIASGG